MAGPSGGRVRDSSASSDEDDSFRGGLGAGKKKSGGGGGGGGRSGFAGGAGGKRVQLDASSGQIAGMRSANYTPHMNLGKGFGDWEKHTKGIGAKLLMQMGYEAGKGLGKDLQGRSEIVEAHLRKGRGAIGAYGSEGGTKKKGKKADSEDEEEKEFKEKLHQWKRGGAGSKKVKYIYKTADQVLEEGKWRKVSKGGGAGGGGMADSAAAPLPSKVKVVDMRGREERVLSGYHAINAKQKRPDDDDEEVGDGLAAALLAKQKPNFEIPELLHNINLIMDTCEESLISADRKLRHNRDKVEVLQMEEEKLANLVDAEKEQIGQLRGALEMVEKLEVAAEEKHLDLDSAMEAFKKMSEEYPREYRVYELPHIASTIVSPLIKTQLGEWRPLQEPERHRDLFVEWRDVLHAGGVGVGSADAPDPFYNLVWDSWMPSVRIAMNQWDTRRPDDLIDFLKAWRDIIPAQIVQNIRNLIILPKLQTEVEQWNPLLDPMPIHSWLHPWLEMLGSELEIVYPTIRHKLATALHAWHPSDKSARLILLPWKEVFDRASLQAFLLKNICPKLETAMQTFAITPSMQNMDVWNWVMDWKDFLSSATLVALLEKAFFPRWLRVLAMWLNNSPNYAEVTQWFQGWKREFAAVSDLLAHAQIKMFLNQALEMMNRAVSPGAPMAMQPGALESVRYLASREASPVTPPPPPPSMAAAPLPPPPTTIPQSFKELVAQRCAQRNIWFTPAPNRSFEGKQVYKCGNINIYLERNVVFAYRNGRWQPMELNTLLDEALS